MLKGQCNSQIKIPEQRKPQNNQVLESAESSESAWMSQGLEAAEHQGPEKS